MLPEMPEPSGTTHILDGQSWSGESDDRKTTKEKKKKDAHHLTSALVRSRALGRCGRFDW